MKNSVGKGTVQWCKALYKSYGFTESEQKVCLSKTINILESYRYVVWSLSSEVDDFYSDAEEQANRQLSEALEYLAEFAPKDTRLVIKDKIISLAWSGYLVDLIDQALVRVSEYPCKKNVYYEILSKNYFTKFTYTDDEITEILDISSSTYYRRKKEAKYLFSAAIYTMVVKSDSLLTVS